MLELLKPIFCSFSSISRLSAPFSISFATSPGRFMQFSLISPFTDAEFVSAAQRSNHLVEFCHAYSYLHPGTCFDSYKMSVAYSDYPAYDECGPYSGPVELYHKAAPEVRFCMLWSSFSDRLKSLDTVSRLLLSVVLNMKTVAIFESMFVLVSCRSCDDVINPTPYFLPSLMTVSSPLFFSMSFQGFVDQYHHATLMP